MQLCYYGELDPFTGIAAGGPAGCNAVIAELKLLCLLYDVIVVPPGNLLEHPYALPAFEALAPFVQAGRLTTSDAPSTAGPHAWFAARAALYAEARAGRGRGAEVKPLRPRSLGLRRRVEIQELLDRWMRLLPERWTVTRDVTSQVAGFSERLRRFCLGRSISKEAGGRILGALDEREQAGGPGLHRTTFLALLAALRAEASPRDLSALAVVGQAAYFGMGASGHTACTLFPGRFAAVLDGYAELVPPGTQPPYDAAAHPSLVSRRARELGVDLGELLALDALRLFEMAASPAWVGVRRCLRGEAPSEEAAQAIRHLLQDARGPRGRISSAAPSGAARPGLPAPWQLAVQGLLGTRLDGGPIAGPVVDLHALVLRDDERCLRARLTRPQAQLLTLLSVSGPAGVHVQDLKQLTLEVDLLESAASGPPPLDDWRPQVRESEALDRARTGRIDVLK
jgi:hypothetical protein